MVRRRSSAAFHRGLALIALLVVVVYAQAINFEFVVLDDEDYVVANPHVLGGLTWSSFWWAWSSIYFCWWHPVTWLSHMADVNLFGLWPGGHHLTSIVLHVASVFALGVLCRRLGLSVLMSLWVTAAVMLHPARVESVAWVSERKDVLCFLFGTLATLGWVEFRRGRGRHWYGFSFAMYLLCLASKSTLVTLPVLLLLGEAWWARRRRVAAGRLGIALAPFFVGATAVGVVSILGQRDGDAVVSLEALAVPARAGFVAVSYVTYLVKTAWPVALCVFTPRESGAGAMVGAVGVLVVVAAGVAVRWRVLRELGYGLAAFVVALAPMVGIVAVGLSLVSDRYMFIPHVPLFLGVARLSSTALASLQKGIVRLAGIAVIAAYTLLSYLQVTTWRDSETLFAHAIETTPPNWRMQSSLGRYLLIAQGRLDEAFPLLQGAAPYDANAQAALGYALALRNDDHEALAQAREALVAGPTNKGVRWSASQVFSLIALRRARAGHLEEATHLFEESLAADPNNTAASTLLAKVRRDLAAGVPPPTSTPAKAP